MKKTLLSLIAILVATAASAQKFVGGDISMLKKFQDEGAIYKDKDGNTVEPLAFFKQQGWNAMRVRLFVDPSKASASDRKEGAIQDLEYVKVLGKCIKDAGFSLMLDFHYSDTWTDPGQHATPSAWSALSVEQMTAKIAEYTKACLQELKQAGAEPDFIQTGNEITTGMLWPTGKIYSGRMTGTKNTFLSATTTMIPTPSMRLSPPSIRGDTGCGMTRESRSGIIFWCSWRNEIKEFKQF